MAKDNDIGQRNQEGSNEMKKRKRKEERNTSALGGYRMRPCVNKPLSVVEHIKIKSI